MFTVCFCTVVLPVIMEFAALAAIPCFSEDGVYFAQTLHQISTTLSHPPTTSLRYPIQSYFHDWNVASETVFFFGEGDAASSDNIYFRVNKSPLALNKAARTRICPVIRC